MFAQFLSPQGNIESCPTTDTKGSRTTCKVSSREEVVPATSSNYNVSLLGHGDELVAAIESFRSPMEVLCGQFPILINRVEVPEN